MDTFFAFQVEKIWIPDVEILNLKEFKTLDVLKKLEGLWLNRDMEFIYAVACRISWICPMTFDNFPLDVQVTNYYRNDNKVLSIFADLPVSSWKFQL